MDDILLGSSWESWPRVGTDIQHVCCGHTSLVCYPEKVSESGIEITDWGLIL
jgi:hypothetical protein